MATIQGIYVALFGRPADPAGLAYFNAATKNGADLGAIGDLTNTAEYQTRFSGFSNTQVINSIYQSLFGRDAEPAGLTFFLDALNKGTLNIKNIAIAILDGAQGSDLVTLTTKLAAAELFTAHLDLPIEVQAYQGNTAAEIGRTFLDTITTVNPGTSANVDAAILRLLNVGGQAPTESGTDGPTVPTIPVDERVYSAGDVHLLQDGVTKATYSFGENPMQAIEAAVLDATTNGAPDGNTLLIKNMSILEGYPTEIIGQISDLVSDAGILPSYKGWMPSDISVGLPNTGDSKVYGTSGNDLIAIIGNYESSHEVTGGRGKDVIVVADLGRFIGGPREAVVAEKPMPITPGLHKIDGGADDDVILNLGGDKNILSGGQGNDLIVLIGDAQDTISGGAGDDIIFGGSDRGRSFVQYFESITSVEGENAKVYLADLPWQGWSAYVAASSTTANQITFLGELPNGDNIIRLNNGGDSLVTWTLKQIGDAAGAFEYTYNIPQNSAIIINVGSSAGTYKVTTDGGPADTADISANTPIKVIAESDFAAGDTLTGGAGKDTFVFVPEGQIGGSIKLPFPGLGNLGSNGADTILDFNTGEDKIAIISNGSLNVSESFTSTDKAATFADAAVAAKEANQIAFFAANVGGDGYLFIDDNQDGQTDFSVKLKGLTKLVDFSASDLKVLDVQSLINGGIEQLNVVGLNNLTPQDLVA